MLVLNHSEYRRKTFQYIALIFIIVFFGFIFSGNFIYSVTGQYVENYLSIYANAHDLLLQKEIPMWSFNFFLGGNFLGAQNVYSLYNPFFLFYNFLALNNTEIGNIFAFLALLLISPSICIVTSSVCSTIFSITNPAFAKALT